MPSSKISALTGSTTPLAGTEVLAVVQSSTTKQVAISNLTAGRAVSMSGMTATGTATVGAYSAPWAGMKAVDLSHSASVYGDGVVASWIAGLTCASYYSSGWKYRVAARDAEKVEVGSGLNYYYASGAGKAAGDAVTWSKLFGVGTTGNVVAYTGDFVLFTPAKGINFTANPHAAGMTSQLLNWYEEGTWTPALFASTSGTITSGSTAGLYIRTGKQVTVTGYIDVVSVSSPVGSLLLTGLPFAASSGLGNRSAATIHATGLAAAATTSIVGRIVSSESQIRIDKFSAGSVSALAGDVSSTTVFHFSATYFV